MNVRTQPHTRRPSGDTDVNGHDEHLVYLYCVTAEPPNLDDAGTAQDGLYLVCEAGLCAVVCRVKAAEFGQSNLRRNLEDPAWLTTETTEHERIVEAIMRERCVIPFRFATLFDNDESLKARLRTHGGRFKTLLKRLEHKSEWGVKVYCDTDKLKHGIQAYGVTLSSLDEAVRSACPGKAFLLKKKREDLAETALAQAMNQYAERTVEVLGQMSVQTRINKVLPSRATERCGDMILNAAFLIDNRDVEAFAAAADAMGRRYAQEGVLVERTGPWPPYNFCDPSAETSHE